jgi:hypothetical protein
VTTNQQVPAAQVGGSGRLPSGPGLVASAVSGVVAVGLAIGVAELLSALGRWAGMLGASSSPITALGQTFIQFTPEWLKELAIRTFGQHDKDALTAGMGLTLPVVAVGIGLLNRRSPRLALAVTAVPVAVAGAAVLTRPDVDVLDLIPLLIGGLAGKPPST